MTPAALSLYVHWPFCKAKCPYCDFNSHVSTDAVDDARWRAALGAELAHFAAETEGRKLVSIFFGGGTPSLMHPETVGALIADAKRYWQADDLEVTLEANPTSAEAGKFRAFAAAGVNRLSLGIQALDDKPLKFLGREHSAKEAEAAITLAKGAFPAFSFDLIYARPGQTEESWVSEMERAFQFSPPHLSLYQLSIEPGTDFYRNDIPAAAEDPAADLFQATQERATAAGLAAYEISNHARDGAQCRHNVAIWQGGDYAGIGPGAHGRLTSGVGTDALFQVYDPGRWLADVEKTGHGTAKRRPLGSAERRQEKIMTGLRLSAGIDADLARTLPRDVVHEMIGGGFLELDGRGLRATPRGRPLLNAVLAKLLAD